MMEGPKAGKPRSLTVAKWLGGGALVFLAVCFIAEVGAYVPKLSYMGDIGAMIVAIYDAWIILAGALSTMLFVFLWRRYRTTFFATGALLGSLVAVLAVVVIVRIAFAVKPLGIKINPFGGLGNTSVSGVPSDSEATYGAFQGRPLKVLIYRPHKMPSERNPVIVYVHGGGWIEGTADLRSKDMRWFANRGWLVFSVEYTLSSDVQHLWNVTPEQIGCALAWIGEHAAEYGGEPSNAFMMGESAGGNLVINAAYASNRNLLKSSCGQNFPRVKAISVAYPVTDVAGFYHNPDPLMSPGARWMTSSYTGGSPESFPDRYVSIDSNTFIGVGVPPTQMIQPEQDGFVSPSSNYKFLRQVAGLGVETRLITVPHGVHADDEVDNGIHDQIFRQATLSFFDRFR
jgi:acetyl esterase/lipase